MTNPIINPSTLSEEQREAIREEYNGWAVFLDTRDEFCLLYTSDAADE